MASARRPHAGNRIRAIPKGNSGKGGFQGEQDGESLKFPVSGQGTLLYTRRVSNDNVRFRILVHHAEKNEQNDEHDVKAFIALEVSKEQAKFVMKTKDDGDDEVTVLASASKTGSSMSKASQRWSNVLDGKSPVLQDPGTNVGCISTYWYSYDRDGCMIKYGKGYLMEETTILKYDFLYGLKEEERAKKRKQLRQFFNPSRPIFATIFSTGSLNDDDEFDELNLSPGANLGKNARGMMVNQPRKQNLLNEESTSFPRFSFGTIFNMGDSREPKPPSDEHSVRNCSEPRFFFNTDPVFGSPSPIVKDSAEITLFDIDRNLYTFSRSLPLSCQELYYNVKNIEVDFPHNPLMPLTDAIRFSMKTRGMFLNNILKSKVSHGEFGDPKKVYIRCTLGPEARSGPGVPYVLEIWPKGCESPIHNHGNSNAVIKVLHGQIQIGIYNKETEPPLTNELLTTFDAKSGQSTWMDANWYQRHKLTNTTNDFCATIQCYKYGYQDTVHWPGFDFVYGNNEELSDTFMPNSDCTFQNLRSRVLNEYEKYLSNTM